MAVLAAGTWWLGQRRRSCSCASKAAGESGCGCHGLHQLPSTWSRCSTPGTPPTKRSPHPGPATPRPCAAPCCSCPHVWHGTRTGGASPRCRQCVPVPDGAEPTLAL